MINTVQTKTAHNSNSRLNGIQYLRGLSALLVVISHCNGILGKPEYYGRMAVPDLHVASVFAVAIFFAISGFIIVIASLGPDRAPRVTRGEYARRRFARIVPFLWLATIGYNLLSGFGTGRFDWPAALRTLVIWPVGELKPNVAWSLRHELLFYAFFAWTMLGPVRRPWLIAVALLASAAFYALAHDAGMGAAWQDSDWFGALQVAMGGEHGANFQFAAGMALAWIYLARPERLPLGRVPPVLMLVLTVLAATVVTLLPDRIALSGSLLWTAMALPILASALCAAPGGAIASRIGLVLGNASFAIYLVHNPVVLVLLVAAKKLSFALATQAELLAFLGLSIALATAGGILVHYLVEAPLIRFVERRTRPASGQPARITAG